MKSVCLSLFLRSTHSYFCEHDTKNKKENLKDPHYPEKSVSWSDLAIKDSALIQGKDELGAGK